MRDLFDELSLSVGGASSALEDFNFPFEEVSKLAEAESWRKEVNRPTTHIHKWWAQRLGTVFRAMCVAAMAPSGKDVSRLINQRVRFPAAVIYDPFMGSGTTIGEALKLGMRAIGRDINPVAEFLVRTAMAPHDIPNAKRTFSRIERDIFKDIISYYETEDEEGEKGTALYYFWVKFVHCPQCKVPIDLFKNYVFAKNAYPSKKPDAKIICKYCGEINSGRYDSKLIDCVKCGSRFDPQTGPAQSQKATCQCCSHQFKITAAVRSHDKPPGHRMYAKLILLNSGRKKYSAITSSDRESYKRAGEFITSQDNLYPIVQLREGHNTRQAINYNYNYWHQMFNDRQLACLGLLSHCIRKIEDPVQRDLMTCLFSGTLEFNNMFASYKGEGTGAVRHMFSHHILKPERTPLEANVWGTSKSSGSFSTLFKSRILKAMEYAANPFEISVDFSGTTKRSTKIFGLSEPLGHHVSRTFQEFSSRGSRVYLSCGDSSSTDIPDASVDAVITDPPFFDNVHYSELADFFHVWQKHILYQGASKDDTTRSKKEVQSTDPSIFTDRLRGIFRECHRVLKHNGLMAFTYHHSRHEGWHSVLRAVTDAQFVITAVHPVKSEMSVAVPKQQAKEPIDIDIIIVCRKQSYQGEAHVPCHDVWSEVSAAATAQVDRFTRSGRHLSRNDVRAIVTGHLVRVLSLEPSSSDAVERFLAMEPQTDHLIGALV